MRYGVIDSFVCPTSGTIFSCIISTNNQKAILWYESSYLLTPGDILTKDKNVLLVNGKHADFILHNISTFNAALWKSLQKRTMCPGNKIHRPSLCNNRAECLFSHCPYGICAIRLQPDSASATIS